MLKITLILCLAAAPLFATCKHAAQVLTLYGDRITNGEELGSVSEIRAAIFHKFQLQGKADHVPISQSSKEIRNDRDHITANRISWIEQRIKRGEVEILSFAGRSVQEQEDVLHLMQDAIKEPGERLPHQSQHMLRFLRNTSLGVTGLSMAAHMLGFSGGPLGGLFTVPVSLGAAGLFHWLSQPTLLHERFANLPARVMSRHLDVHVEVLQDPGLVGWAFTTLPFATFERIGDDFCGRENSMDVVTFHDHHTHAPNTTIFLWRSPTRFGEE